MPTSSGHSESAHNLFELFFSLLTLLRCFKHALSCNQLNFSVAAHVRMRVKADDDTEDQAVDV